MEDYYNHYISNLSGGQQQKIALLLSMINSPEVLFLDEPTLGLDVETRRILWGLIEEVKRQGKTVLITTHYANEIESFCDRVIIMKKGEIRLNSAVSKLQQNLPFKHKIIFKTTNLDDIKEIVPRLKQDASIHDVLMDDDKVFIFTNHYKETIKVIEQLLKKDADNLAGFALQNATLEDLFISIVGGKLDEK